MKEKTWKGKKAKQFLSLVLTLAMVFSLMPGNVEKVKAADDVTTVSDLEGLESALANENITRVIVSQTITLTDGTELDGQGKTVQVEVPYLEESGATSDSPSNYNVFTVDSGANVTIKNMKIFGGMKEYNDGSNDSFVGGIIIAGTLTLENITIARSCRGLCVSSSGKAVLKNTNIVRNQCTFGGGILCAGGTLVMDGCSLTENRSTGSGYGGGAMEIKGSGTLYANNTVIANNSSSEIGGAINNYQSNVYLMNCQVIGNVTTNAATYGGGLGINRGTLKAVNSIFKDNYFISAGTGGPVASDVGIYAGTGNELINCIYGKIQGSESAVTKTGCQEITTDSIFANYRNDGVLYGSSNNYTTGFSHPSLRAKDGNSYALYANPSDSGEARSGGVDTYFDYSELSGVKMSYGTADSMTAMTTNPADASCKVTTYYEGGERTSGVIGASAVSDSVFYTVKLGGVPSHGIVQGISIYGDSYAEGASVTVSAIPNTGYVFTGWKKGEEKVSTNAKYTFSVTENLNLTAEFTAHDHEWNYMNGTGEDANKLYAFCSNGNACPYAGSTGDVSKAVSLTLSATSQNYSGEAVTATYGSGEAEAWKTATGDDAPEITYYLEDGETTTTEENSGASGEGQAPVNEGTYVAKITVPDTTVTASKEFEIHKHGNGVKQNGKSATCTTDGWKDYYQCSCDAFYEDAACTTEITDLDAWKTTKGKIAATGHAWTYTASGATLSATCSNNSKHTAALTLTATTQIYSGSAVTASYGSEEAKSWKAATGDAAPGITYYLENGESRTTTENSGAAGEGKAPVKVGKYVAKITVSDATASKAFEIKAPHTHNGVKQDGQAATCTTDGWKDYYQCSCGVFYEDAVCTTKITDLDTWKTTGGKIAAKGHTEAIDAAVSATCTETGLTEGKHCSVCNEVIVAQEAISALGHDWSDEWTVIKEATATEEGKKEKNCKREGCTSKKYEIIPKIGTTDELPKGVSGSLEKDAEVAQDAPIEGATLGNKKAELFEAASIFTEEEKQKIASQSAEARVWLEVSKTKEEGIAEKDRNEIQNTAAEITGNNSDITYFDASLFKKVGNGEKCKLSEPGIEIRVTIQIPEALLRVDKTMLREYKIIRLHVKGASSEVSIIGGTFDENTKEFTFMTDRFSTYAIVYKDTPVTTVTPTVTPEPTATAGPTATLEPTVTAIPTATVEPTETVTPTATVEPTATAGPTATLEPTVTAIPTATVAPTNPPTVTMTLAPTKNPTVTKKPVTPTKKVTKAPTPTPISKKTLEKNALALNSKLKVSQTGSKINVSWGKVSGAEGYNVYVQYCGKAFTAKSLNSVKSGKTTKITITKVNGKKLDLKKNFKVYVEAYKKVNGKKVTLGKTVTAHIIGRKNTQCTNVKAVKVKKSSYILKVGKTATIKASTVLVDKTKKQLSDKHAKEFRYATSNKKVATVSGSGKIKAVGKGSCSIYVYARNGYAKKVTVKVK